LHRRWTFLPILGYACLALAAHFAGCGETREDPRLAQAREALAKGEIQRAHDLISDLLREKPDSGEALDLKGLALQSMGRAEAEQAFREAIRRIPKRAEPHDHLAAFLYQSGRTEEAIAEWQAAVRENSQYAVGHYNLGSAYQRVGRLDQAVTEFRQALKLKPELTSARINLGIVLVTMGRFPEAEKELREAARQAPEDPEVAFNLGAAYVSARRTEDGIRELRRALALRPDFAEARERMGTAFFYDGKLEEAAREFGEALKIRPKYAEAHFGLGVLLSEEGKEEEAIREYERTLENQPDHAAASTNLALLYGRTGKTPPRGTNRVAAFEIYRRRLLEKNWDAAWSILSRHSRALYLDDPERFRYAARKGFDDPRVLEKLAAPGFFLRYLEPPSPDPASGLPYDPAQMGAVRESSDGEWKVDLLVVQDLPGPDPER